MGWWIWIAAGFALLFFELVVPSGAYLYFFGAGALVVGLLVVAGLADPLWLQGVLFAAFSLVSLLIFRPLLLRRLQAGTAGGEIDSLVGEMATALGEIAPLGSGKVELRGTTWNARNAGSTPIGPDRVCCVDRIEGLVLWVRNE